MSSIRLCYVYMSHRQTEALRAQTLPDNVIIVMGTREARNSFFFPDLCGVMLRAGAGGRARADRGRAMGQAAATPLPCFH